MATEVYFREDIGNVLDALILNRFGPRVTRQTTLNEADEAYLRALASVARAFGIDTSGWLPREETP